jgi:hypothetical protein
MHIVDVNNMKFTGKQQPATKINIKIIPYIYTFIITDVITDNPIYNKSATSGAVLPAGMNQLLDLDTYAINFILCHMKNELISNNQRKMLVINITDYPYVTSYFDYRDQSEINKNTLLSKIITREWENRNSIPTILVNSNIYHTNLKLIPINI